MRYPKPKKWSQLTRDEKRRRISWMKEPCKRLIAKDGTHLGFVCEVHDVKWNKDIIANWIARAEAELDEE